MKIIEDRSKRYPVIIRCENCGSQIKIESQADITAVDKRSWEYEAHYWICPCCREENVIYYDTEN